MTAHVPPVEELQRELDRVYAGICIPPEAVYLAAIKLAVADAELAAHVKDEPADHWAQAGTDCDWCCMCTELESNLEVARSELYEALLK